jgi:hypothetical protein
MIFESLHIAKFKCVCTVSWTYFPLNFLLSSISVFVVNFSLISIFVHIHVLLTHTHKNILNGIINKIKQFYTKMFLLFHIVSIILN